MYSEITKNIINTAVNRATYKKVVDNINKNLVGDDLCIQYAIIPENLKKIFIDQFNPKNNVKEITYQWEPEKIYKVYNNITPDIFKKEYENLYTEYKIWLESIFFKKKNFITFDTDIMLRTQIYVKNTDTYEFNSAYHREFDDKDNRKTPNTHLILYYPFLNNCLTDCGTQIKYMNTNGEIKEIILPADDNVVYCIRDCCFVHMTPYSNPKTRGMNIDRVLVRSYVTLEGYKFETSLCPTLLGGYNQKKRKYKSKKHHILKNRTKKQRLSKGYIFKGKSRLVERP